MEQWCGFPVLAKLACALFFDSDFKMYNRGKQIKSPINTIVIWSICFIYMHLIEQIIPFNRSKRKSRQNFHVKKLSVFLDLQKACITSLFPNILEKNSFLLCACGSKVISISLVFDFSRNSAWKKVSPIFFTFSPLRFDSQCAARVFEFRSNICPIALFLLADILITPINKW